MFHHFRLFCEASASVRTCPLRISVNPPQDEKDEKRGDTNGCRPSCSEKAAQKPKQRFADSSSSLLCNESMESAARFIPRQYILEQSVANYVRRGLQQRCGRLDVIELRQPSFVLNHAMSDKASRPSTDHRRDFQVGHGRHASQRCFFTTLGVFASSELHCRGAWQDALQVVESFRASQGQALLKRTVRLSGDRLSLIQKSW